MMLRQTFRYALQNLSRLPAFARNERGNVAITFALTIIPILGLVGAAIDYTRANNARTAMQAALDSTALMISKDAPNLSATDLTTKAQAYFSALYNHPETAKPTVTATYTASSNIGSQVVLTGTSSMPTQIMKVVGFSNLPITSSSTAAWGNVRMRVALVLDTTGSMADDGKMTALKPAAKSLIDQISATAKTQGDVYISIIPFAKDVNADPANYSKTWLNWTQWEAEPPKLDTAQGGSKPSTWSQIGPGSTCPFTSNSYGFTCTDRPATLSGAVLLSNVSSPNTNKIPSSGTYAGYICPSIDSGSKVSSKSSVYYNGCYTSDVATQTIASGNGASCGGTTNCTCSGSGSSKVCTQTYYTHTWRKVGTAAAPAHSTWNGCSTDRDQDFDIQNTAPTSGSTLFIPEQWSACPTALAPLSYDWTSLKAKIDLLSPNGNTNQGIGMAWGWQSLAQSDPLNAPAEDASYKYSKVLIIMSDGLNTQDRWYTSAASIDAREASLCTNIKAANITIYTIQVNTSSPADATSTVLKNCASGTDKFFMLTSSNQLATTFSAIGTALSKLRIAY